MGELIKKFVTGRFPDTRNRTLSLGLISLTVSFCFLVVFIINGNFLGLLFYGFVGAIYLSVYYFLKGKDAILIFFGILFYLFHTTVELSFGFSLESLSMLGFEHNSSKTDSPYSLFLLLPDILRYTYPIFRYTLVASFLVEPLGMMAKAKR